MFFAQKEKGQGMVEYALILALIAIVVIVAMNIVGTGASTQFSSVGASI